jgi:hypothetical protein
MNAAAARRRREILIDYLLAKVQECDWYGVSDAANDIRVLEAQYPIGEADGDNE